MSINLGVPFRVRHVTKVPNTGLYAYRRLTGDGCDWKIGQFSEHGVFNPDFEYIGPLVIEEPLLPEVVTVVGCVKTDETQLSKMWMIETYNRSADHAIAIVHVKHTSRRIARLMFNAAAEVANKEPTP